MSIAKVEAKVRDALGHKMFDELRKSIPREDYNDPRQLAQWLLAASSLDPAGAQRPEFRAAYGALNELSQANELRDTAQRLFHDPKLRAEIGEARIEAAWRDPETAYAELIQRSAAGRLSPSLSEALNTIAQVRQFVTDNGGEMPAQAEVAMPNGAAARDDEYKSLIAKSASTRLSAADEARLMKLAEAQIAAGVTQEQAAEALASHGKALGIAAKPDLYAQLIQKSISAGGLTADESARLEGLATARAEAAGLIEPADMPDSNPSEGIEDG